MKEGRERDERDKDRKRQTERGDKQRETRREEEQEKEREEGEIGETEQERRPIGDKGRGRKTKRIYQHFIISSNYACKQLNRSILTISHT